MLFHLRQLLAQCFHTAADVAAVGFDFGFAGSARADAASQPRHLHALAGQTRQHIFELRQLHLELALTAARTQRENIEYQRGAVDHAHIGRLFHILYLCGRQLAVRHDQVDLLLTAQLGHLRQFAAAHIGGALGLWELLGQQEHRLGACALDQLAQLAHGRLRVVAAGVHTHQQCARLFFFITDQFHWIFLIIPINDNGKAFGHLKSRSK